MSGIDIGPKIGIEGEKQFKDAIKAVNSQIKATASELKVLAAESGKSEDAARNLSQRQKVLGESLDANKTKIKTLTSQYDRQKSMLDELGTALEKARKENGEGSDEAIKAENAYSKQARAVNDLETQINTAKTQIGHLSGELETNSIKLQEAKSHAIKYGDAMKSAGDKIAGIGTGISKVGGALTLGVTTPLVAAGTASVKFATDAETSFAKVGTIADSAVLSYDKMKSGVISASNESGIAVTDFNEALYSSISAGVESGDAISFTSDMVKLAKGGFTDTAKAVDVVTTVLNAYGLEADQATAISDKLITTQNLGKTTVDELASSMGKVIPTANSVNIGIDDVAATMATLTKNGIATAEATTYYNSMLNELGKSGSTADEALKEIAGKSFKDLVTEGKPVTEILQMLSNNAANSGLSLSDMFGSAEASKAALTIMKDGGGEYNEILQQMEDSAGATQTAFEKMDSTPAAKMQKELNKLKNAGIETGNKLLPVVTKIVDGAGKLLDAYNDLDDGSKDLILRTAGIAAAAGPVLKITGTATTGIGKLTSGVGGLVKDLGKLNSAKKAADAISKVGSQAVKSVEGVSGFSKVLFKLGSPGGIALLAAGVLVGVGAAFLKVRDDAIKADIAAHFGNVKLSAEEVEDVAKRLTTTDWTVKVGAVIEAKEKLEQSEKDLESSIETLNTLDWKVQVGLELTEEETASYQSAIDGFVKSAQDYVSQQGYTVSLALDATIGKDTSAGDGLATFSDNYFASAESQLQDLGERLSEKVNNSFENGTFAEDRIEIQKIVDQMNGVLKEIQDAEHAAKLDNMKIEYSTENLGIDKESFDKLNEKISENTQELLDDSKETQVTALTSVNLMYKKMTDSGIPEEFARKVYEDAKAKIEQSTLETQGEAINMGFDFAFDKVSKNYKDQIESSKQEIIGYTDDYATEITDAYDEGGQAVNDAFTNFLNFNNTLPQLSDDAKRTVNDMLESLKPQKEVLQGIADDCLAAGKSVPESVKQGLSDIAEWEAMSGSASGMYTKLAEQLADDPAKLQALMQNEEFGRSIPDELAKAITLYSGYAYDSVTGMWNKVSEGTELSAAEVSEYLNTAGAGLDENLAQGIASQYGLAYNSATGMWEAVTAATNGTTADTNVNSKGQEIGVAQGEGIAEGAASQTDNVQTASGDLVKSSETGIEAALPEAEKTAVGGGEGIGEDLAQGIENTESEVDSSAGSLARSAAQEMQLTINGIKLNPPGMNTPDWTSAASLGRNSMQNYLSNNPLSITVNQHPGSVAYHASGGIFTAPHLAVVAEEPAGEAIIPLSSSRRADALNILDRTAEIIGYDAYAYVANAGRSIGASRTNPPKTEPPRQTVYQFEEGAIQNEIHTQAADPNEIYRVVSRRMNQDVKRVVKGHGHI